jgi:hypothetical protein
MTTQPDEIYIDRTTDDQLAVDVMVGSGAHVASVRLTLDGGPTPTVATTAAFELRELLQRLVAESRDVPRS